MLPKKNRLTTRYEFNKTRYMSRKEGSVTNNEYYTLFVLRLKDSDQDTRFGIVVGKHVSKKAVDRNTIKRWFREAIRNNSDSLNKGYWVVIQPKKECLQGNYEKINTLFSKDLQEYNITG